MQFQETPIYFSFFSSSSSFHELCYLIFGSVSFHFTLIWCNIQENRFVFLLHFRSNTLEFQDCSNRFNVYPKFIFDNICSVFCFVGWQGLNSRVVIGYISTIFIAKILSVSIIGIYVNREEDEYEVVRGEALMAKTEQEALYLSIQAFLGKWLTNPDLYPILVVGLLFTYTHLQFNIRRLCL